MSIATIDSATIRAVAQLTAQKFNPEQIILFGSHALAPLRLAKAHPY